MGLKKYKWPFYVFTFLLITVVAVVMKEIEGRVVPPVSNAIILVVIVYAIIFVVVKIGSKLFKKPQKTG
jgi:hypothetical protein